MLTVQKPTESDVIAYLLAQTDEPFSYAGIGATRNGSHDSVDRRLNWDCERVLLGSGESTWQRACEAIRGWEMFPREMVELYWPDRPQEAGTVVATLFRAGPIWSLNPCRIVYAIDESTDDQSRFGFAYGTLPDHMECGEELFLVEWDRREDRVWYELTAFSRPRHALARLGYPIVRREQARFRRLSAQAMSRFVGLVNAQGGTLLGAN